MVKTIFFASVILFTLNACQTHLPIVSDAINSPELACDEDIDQIELADIDYLLYANKMVDSLTTSKFMQSKAKLHRMYLKLSPVMNNTNEAINMVAINSAVKNRLLRSGQFVLNTASSVHLTGSFDEVEQATKLCVKKYKKFSLQLIDEIDNKILWSESKRFN